MTLFHKRREIQRLEAYDKLAWLANYIIAPHKKPGAPPVENPLRKAMRAEEEKMDTKEDLKAFLDSFNKPKKTDNGTE